jgi:penicillin-binding protein-related factor A (putative recombinase)
MKTKMTEERINELIKMFIQEERELIEKRCKGVTNGEMERINRRIEEINDDLKALYDARHEMIWSKVPEHMRMSNFGSRLCF